MKNTILVVGSKPNSNVPNFFFSKIYAANGACLRLKSYKKKYINSKLISIVGTREFAKKQDLQKKVLASLPKKIIFRSGKIHNSLKKKLKKKFSLKIYSKVDQFFFQSQFFNWGIFTLIFAELFYGKNLVYGFLRFIKKFKNFEILGASTGLFAVLLALKENPGSKIVLCGIGIDTGGGTFYKKNYSKFLLRRKVDKKLFIFLKKEYKKNLLTTDNKISLKHGIKLFEAKL